MSLIHLVGTSPLVNATVTTTNTSPSVSLYGALGYSVVSQITVISALGSTTAKLQASNDNNIWIDIDGSTQSITTSANYMWNVDRPYYAFVRIVHTVGSGSMSVIANIIVKGY